ncbi:MAG: hypothetical protein UH853_00315 [Muribaculaceae bacterium]|nr:hypothetical protein [Muribaculaceae bacterium]
MKKETIQKRLSRTQINKNSSEYRLLTEWLNKEDNPLIRPCWVSGSGRYIKNNDYTYATTLLLRSLRVRFEVGNDAPRGGKSGNFIKILL